MTDKEVAFLVEYFREWRRVDSLYCRQSTDRL
nr:MAG TPA: hypothetical protein [Caudoviricetes sp.]